MLLFLLACTSEKNLDTALSDTATETATETAETSCFSAESEAPYIVYATPYLSDGTPASNWVFLAQDGSSQDFSMGRSSMGEISISSDGSWGVVPQEDGSVGVFRVQNGQVSVLHESLTLSTAHRNIYTTQVWLDSINGRLWIVDSNWPDNGGGLFVADIDCSSGQIAIAEDVFRSKNALEIAPFSSFGNTADSLIFLSREVNETAQQVTIFDADTHEMTHSAQAFDDDEAIFSALATDGEHILAGDNSQFSGVPNRVSHLKLMNNTLERQTIIEVEDPIAINIYEGLALIASGFGNSLWQYNLSDSSLTELSLSPSIELPSAIIQHDQHFYVAENTAIRHILFEQGEFTDQGFIVDTSGVEGIIGAIGLFGEH